MIERAVVVGGSFAGLAVAAALSPRATEVVVLERRSLPANGEVASVAAQGSMPHVLLGGGAAAIESLLPGFHADVIRRGGVDAGRPVPCHWWAAGGVRHELPDLGIPSPMASRALVETTLREQVRALGNVAFVDDVSAQRLHLDHGRVIGLSVEHGGSRQFLDTTLVTDAGGRSGRAADWLDAEGWAPPPVTEVTIGMTYTALRVRRAWDPTQPAFAVVQNSPALARIGVALQAEADQLQIVLGGYFGDTAGVDRAGLLEFARSLPDPVIAEFLTHDWLAEPRRYQFRSSIRRHWERIRMPVGLFVVGDAVASFNPVYGQGMTSAALQAASLGTQLDRHGNTSRGVRRAARANARIVANPWRVAAGADFMYAATEGARPPGVAAVNGYLERVFRAAPADPVVGKELARVQQMLAPPSVLFRPGVLARVAHGSVIRDDRGVDTPKSTPRSSRTTSHDPQTRRGSVRRAELPRRSV